MTLDHVTLKCLALQVLEAFFVDYESFLELNSPDFLALCERNLDDSGNFTVRGCFPLIWKNSATHMLYDLVGYLKKGLPFAGDLSLENSVDSYLCFSAGFTSLSLLLFFPLLIAFFVFMHGFLIPIFSIKMISASLLTTLTI